MIQADGQMTDAVRAPDAPAPARLRAGIRRAGRTCVLSGVGLRSDELLELAAWNGSMDIARIHPGLLPRLAPAVHRPAP